jgi:hypothetical protein
MQQRCPYNGERLRLAFGVGLRAGISTQTFSPQVRWGFPGFSCDLSVIGTLRVPNHPEFPTQDLWIDVGARSSGSFSAHRFMACNPRVFPQNLT